MKPTAIEKDMKKQTKSSWIERFEKRFIKHKLFARGAWGFEVEDIKQFISKELKNEYERGYKDGQKNR